VGEEEKKNSNRAAFALSMASRSHYTEIHDKDDVADQPVAVPVAKVTLVRGPGWSSTVVA
jgi:hypothetical protein